MNPQKPIGQSDSPTNANPPSFRAIAQAGSLWMGAAVAIQAAVGVGAQILLGVWLLPFDFGVFALFLSSAFVFDVFAVGGIRTALTRRSSSSIDSVALAAFGRSLLFAVGAMLVLSLLSPLLSTLLGEPALVPIILVGALALPLRSYATVAIPMLQSRRQFRSIAVAMTLAALSRYAVAICLAYAGLGAMALTLGLVAGAAVLSASLLPATLGAIRRSGPVQPPRSESFRVSPWALSGDIAALGSTRVDYFVLGIFVPTSVVGGYYFAYQLVARGGQLLLGVSRNVLFPLLAQIRGNDAQQIRGLYKGGAALVLVGGAGAAFLVAAMPAIERAVWDGRWAWVMPAVAILATALPLQIAVAAPEQLLKARGDFKSWTVVLSVRAIGVASVALIVGLVAGDALSPTMIAAALASYLVLEALVEMAVLSRLLSFDLRVYWKAVLPLSLWFAGLGWLGALVVDQIAGGPLVSVSVVGALVGLGSVMAIGLGNRARWFQSRLI